MTAAAIFYLSRDRRHLEIQIVFFQESNAWLR